MPRKHKPMKEQMELPFEDESLDLEAEFEKVLDHRNPDTINDVLNLCFSQKERERYMQILRQLKELQGLELLKYAGTIGLTSAAAERDYWNREAHSGRDATDRIGGPTKRFGGERHNEFINMHRRASLFELVIRMIHGRVRPKDIRERAAPTLKAMQQETFDALREAISDKQHKPR